jgi:VWFA-related protein
VQVAFQPQSDATFSSTLQVNSNASSGTVVTVPITGTREMATAWTVRINQVDAGAGSCPQATAYVSVTDQGGFAVTGLTAANFIVSHGGGTPAIKSFSTVEGTAFPVAIAAALDHSESLTRQPVAFADMKSGFATFFGGLRSGDSGAVINFDSAVELVQTWTTDKTLLQAAAVAPWDKGPDTKLYDAAFLAVDQAATQPSARRAVILATDGEDLGPTSPYSTATLAQVIANGTTKSVPIFTIGVGSSVNKTVLTQMASGTGGLFYEASTSQNLATIYQQLTTLLNGKQYVITFDRATGPIYNVFAINATPPAGVTATGDTRPITPCP